MTNSAGPLSEHHSSGYFSLRALRCFVPIVVAILGLVLLCSTCWLVLGPVIPARTLHGLRGATRGQVRRILGDPTEVQPSGDWNYMRPFNPGWVEIYFDEVGRVSFVNDEQAAPEFWGSGSWQD